MRICLFDTILERHVVDSLERALVSAGHSVFATGPIWKGHRFPTDSDDLMNIRSFVDKVIAWKPDFVFLFRASTLTPDLIEAFREKQIPTIVWLPDDPVLYAICYRHIVDHHDIVLHCGGVQVHRFYQDRGHAAGVNFPFWTDHEAFPACYDPAQADIDLVFLGNCAGQVRKKRYDMIGSLPGIKRIFGKVEQDPLAIHGGYIADSDNQNGGVSEVFQRARVGINIPQVFETYRGSGYDFPELAGFGCFQLPSRVVQYAASGLPVVSLGGATDIEAVLPEVLTVETIMEARELCRQLLEDTERLLSNGKAMLARFDRDYSGAARVRFLEYLLDEDQSWRSASPEERAELFMHHPKR